MNSIEEPGQFLTDQNGQGCAGEGSP